MEVLPFFLSLAHPWKSPLLLLSGLNLDYFVRSDRIGAQMSIIAFQSALHNISIPLNKLAFELLAGSTLLK